MNRSGERDKQPSQKLGRSFCMPSLEKEASLEKDGPHRYLLEKCKSKLQWGTTSYLTEWPILKNRMANTKKPTNNKCWTGWTEKRTLLHCWWECKFVQPLMENSVNALQKTKNRITIWPANPTPGYIPRQNYNSIQYMHSHVHNSQNIHNSQNMKQLKWPSIRKDRGTRDQIANIR